ncbi:hypothetical protein E2562_030371 [Oryza meyeriana var. granulata]|uniref:Uncharacterized protein n=1 Tax=Oryza meyeriana var. granulata TaxID=110450 RepID=A0A6G1DQ58_9ORYZ|nr:hypothetical protein E2562_030371 [Oryza meyeriana var. granulata]
MVHSASVAACKTLSSLHTKLLCTNATSSSTAPPSSGAASPFSPSPSTALPSITATTVVTTAVPHHPPDLGALFSTACQFAGQGAYPVANTAT